MRVPQYYFQFKCIADRCTHSCCVGWEIDVDERTLARYRALSDEIGDAIAASIEENEDGAHFRLCADERCPHLDERGLCKIILQEGEDYLSHICREHPRFYNYTDVAEVGLGMSCIEAAELILSSPDYGVMEEIGEVDAEQDGVAFDGRAERNAIYAVLQDEEKPYARRLEQIYQAHGIDVGDDARWLELMDTLGDGGEVAAAEGEDVDPFVCL